MPVTLFITFHSISIQICLDFMITDTLSPPPPPKKNFKLFLKSGQFLQEIALMGGFGSNIYRKIIRFGYFSLNFSGTKKTQGIPLKHIKTMGIHKWLSRSIHIGIWDPLQWKTSHKGISSSPTGKFSSANLQAQQLQFWKVALFLFALVLLHPVGLVSVGLPQWLPSCPGRKRHRNSGTQLVPTRFQLTEAKWKKTANFKVYIFPPDIFLPNISSCYCPFPPSFVFDILPSSNSQVPAQLAPRWHLGDGVNHSPCDPTMFSAASWIARAMCWPHASPLTLEAPLKRISAGLAAWMTGNQTKAPLVKIDGTSKFFLFHGDGWMFPLCIQRQIGIRKLLKSSIKVLLPITGYLVWNLQTDESVLWLLNSRAFPSSWKRAKLNWRKTACGDGSRHHVFFSILGSI